MPSSAEKFRHKINANNSKNISNLLIEGARPQMKPQKKQEHLMIDEREGFAQVSINNVPDDPLEFICPEGAASTEYSVGKNPAASDYEQ